MTQHRPCLLCSGAHRTAEHGYGSYDDATTTVRLVMRNLAVHAYHAAERPTSTWEGDDACY